jgi:hypothetical protein
LVKQNKVSMNNENQTRLPSIHELLNSEEFPSMTNQNTFRQEETKKIPQMIHLECNLESNASKLEAKPSKMEISEKIQELYDNFHLKKQKEVKVETQKKSVWVFEENVLENRGRKGKQQEWRTGIKKFYKSKK